MQTDQRLTQAYRNARIETIDKDSKIVFMSDCHRGNGSSSDEFSRNQNAFVYALYHYLDLGYTYVEAGDGDELWEYKFKDIKLAHEDAFSVMRLFHKNNRLIMMIGNHNIFMNNQDYVTKNLFTSYDKYSETVHELLNHVKPIEALVLKVKETGQEIFVVHGHQGDFNNDQNWFMSMLSLRYFWRFMHAFGFHNPASPVRNVQRRHKIEKNYNKWIEKHQMMLICGHTHRYKYPKLTELPYFNTGCCIYPTSLTAIEIENGEIMLVQWRTIVNLEGVLQIVREIIRGPVPLTKFDLRNRE
ncbi:MAG: hypothetical protein FD179_97 [Erysipelotrichaceae bacterium]|nr:MAG: hypothetical protein FD179_97 [Erysipelotrichaceae bacterium]